MTLYKKIGRILTLLAGLLALSTFIFGPEIAKNLFSCDINTEQCAQLYTIQEALRTLYLLAGSYILSLLLLLSGLWMILTDKSEFVKKVKNSK